MICLNEKDFMLRAISLATRGTGNTSPNPLVGAVIVKNGKIIAEGYHEKYGELHAERNAIKSAKESLEGATMYVTLEPCCHYGKTPPCTEAIIENKIAKVVIGSRDPNEKVSGKGVRILKEAGIEVVEDFMKEECDKLNDVFFHYITTKRPYVVMKYAMTVDGKICTSSGESKWITGEDSREYVHYLRHKYKGIMVGRATVEKDNPMLNCRMENGVNPIRIICDSNLKIDMNSNIVKTAKQIETIIACIKGNNNIDGKKKLLENEGVKVIEVASKEGKIDLQELMEKLGEMKIDSILLEGGAELNFSAINQKIVNKVLVFIAPKLLGGKAAKSPISGKGIEKLSECVNLSQPKITTFKEDILIEYSVKKEA